MHRHLSPFFLGFALASAAWGGGTIPWPVPPPPPEANPAATVVPPLTFWLNRFQRNLIRSHQMDKVDLIFDCDQWALTAGPYGDTGGMWKRFNKYHAYDFGTPSETTQSVLWRLQHGQADGLHPKLIVLQVGGLNLGTNTPEQIAEGVKAVIAEYQKRCPDATILLLGVFPRGEKATDTFRPKLKAINQLISALGDGQKVIYLDLGDKMLQPDGTISKEVMADFLHPSPKGFAIWADGIQPVIDQFFPPASMPASASAPAPDSPASPAPPGPLTTAAFPGGTVNWPPPPVPAGANSAIIPQPPLNWLAHFQQNIDDSHKLPQVDLIFDGDSITAGWKGAGGGIWGHHYAKLNAFDFGVSGDTTQGLLWRVQNGQVDGLHPKLIVLLIGTNNMYSCSAEQIAGGIKADVEEYRKRCPDATILVQGILPRGEKATEGLRAKVKAVNKIVAGLADGQKVIFLDWGDKLLLPDGSYTKPITTDFLHFGAPGYQIWADAIQPVIDQSFPAVGLPAAATPAPSP